MVMADHQSMLRGWGLRQGEGLGAGASGQQPVAIISHAYGPLNVIPQGPNSYAYTQAHTHKLAHTHTHTYTHIHTYSTHTENTHACTHTQRNTHKDTHQCAPTHKHKHKHILTRKYTHDKIKIKHSAMHIYSCSLV